MGQALYRKYRSKSLDEVLGQDHITSTLKNALKSGKISHAYLFTGPRGVGKTSVARILAYEVNKMPYTEGTPQLDIIEIDAASNRRIDEIRDLRDKVHITPTSSKYKVYIIDEVHMLTKEAFNALLKTLEEPPEHVIFILATTESHKLPETIVSRTQRFTFKPIDDNQVIKQLKHIAKTENIDIDDSALALIAQHGEGSFRDSISLLDQAGSTGKPIRLGDVQRMLGIAPASAMDEILLALAKGSPQQLLETLSQLQEQGYQASHIAKQLGHTLRNHLLQGDGPLTSSQTMALLKNLLDIQSNPQPNRLLEVVLLEVVLDSGQETNVNTKQTKPHKDESSGPTPAAHKAAEAPKPSHDSPKPRAKHAPAKDKFSLDQWSDILDSVKDKHSTLYSVLRMATPSYDQSTLTLSFQFAFHQKQASEAKNLRLLQEVINQYSTHPVTISSVAENGQAPEAASSADSSPNIDAISNIFGGAEVLES